jgi:hypothetical protein
MSRGGQGSGRRLVRRSHCVRAVWLAIEDGRIDGRDLFLHLARTPPESRRAPALFLFGWKSWREGHGALASMAVERALHADPVYSAATLLQAALTQGIDPPAHAAAAAHRLTRPAPVG